MYNAPPPAAQGEHRVKGRAHRLSLVASAGSGLLGSIRLMEEGLLGLTIYCAGGAPVPPGMPNGAPTPPMPPLGMFTHGAACSEHSTFALPSRLVRAVA